MPELRLATFNCENLMMRCDFSRAGIPQARERLALVSARFHQENDWTSDALEASLKAMAGEMGLGLGKLAQPLRAALTGQTTSPGIFDVLVLLGRDESLARIDAQACVSSETGN